MSAIQVPSQPVPTRTTVRRLVSKRSRQLGRQLVFTEISWLAAISSKLPSSSQDEVTNSRQSLM